MEVIYTGLHQTPEQIVETVIQEDADAVGLSILSGAHMTLVPRIAEGLKSQGIEDVVLVVGGTIPSEDIPELKQPPGWPRSSRRAPPSKGSSTSSARRCRRIGVALGQCTRRPRPAAPHTRYDRTICG